MRISDWSSDVCSSDLPAVAGGDGTAVPAVLQDGEGHRVPGHRRHPADRQFRLDARPSDHHRGDLRRHPGAHPRALRRSEEHTSELQSLMRSSYAVFCLKKKNNTTTNTYT